MNSIVKLLKTRSSPYIGKTTFRNIFYGIFFSLAIFSTVSVFDFLINLLQPIFLNSSQEHVTLPHFSWYVKEIISSDGILKFIDGVIAHKKGLLGERWTYWVLLTAFLIWSFFFFVVILVNTQNQTICMKREGLLRLFRKKQRMYILLLLLLLWVFVKQVLFVVIIPPWQTPDETFHFLKVGFYSKSYEELRTEVIESTTTFEFTKHSELPRVPHFPDSGWSRKQIEKSQPALYYFILNAFNKYTGGSDALAIIYKGRFISSLCLIVTVMFVFFIARKVFKSDESGDIAILSSVFAGAHPQLSYVGASCGVDSMVVMFVSAALFFMILSFDEGWSSKRIISYFFVSALFSLCAMATKSIGIAIMPAIFVTFVMIMAFRLKPGRERIGYLFAIIGFLAMASLLLWSFDIFGFKSYIHYRLPAMLNTFLAEFGRVGLRNGVIYFVSFWLSYGWMVYKMSLGSYLFLGGMTGIVLYGVKKNFSRKVIDINKMAYTLLFIFALTTIALVHMHGRPQGRFLLPAITLFSILFAEGLSSIVSSKIRSLGVNIISGYLILCNVLIVFGFLIPIFYLIEK